MRIDKLKAVMQEKHMSGYRLAKETGVRNSTITRILNGNIKDIHLSLAKKIADVFDMTVDELFL